MEQEFFSNSCRSTFKGLGVTFHPCGSGGKLDIAGIIGFVGEFQMAIKADDFDDWVRQIITEDINLTPTNIGYYREIGGKTVTVEKTREGYHSEVIVGSRIELYHDGDNFEEVRGVAITHVNSKNPLKSGSIDVHRLTPHPNNSLIYQTNNLNVNAIRLSFLHSGQLQEITANTKGEVIIGNSRWRAAFYDDQGVVNPTIDSLRTLVKKEGDEVSVIVEGNTYRRTRGNLELANEAAVIFSRYSREELLAGAKSQGLKKGLQYVAVLLGVGEKGHSNLKRVLKVKKWLHGTESHKPDYPQSLVDKAEQLLDKTAANAEKVIKLLRNYPDVITPQGAERIIDILLKDASKTPEEAIGEFKRESGINTAPAPTPEPVKQEAIPSYPEPQVTNFVPEEPAYPEPQVTNFAPENGKTPIPVEQLPEKAPVATLERLEPEPEAPEEKASVIVQIKHDWQPPNDVIKVVEWLSRADSRKWQVITGDSTIPKARQSGFFYYPELRRADFGAFLLTTIKGFLKKGKTLSAILALPPEALFCPEAQATLVELESEYNKDIGSVSIACWHDKVTSLAETPNGQITREHYLMLYPLGTPLLMDALSETNNKAMFLGL